jgi:hypothetical protein
MRFVLSDISVDDVIPGSEKLETAIRSQLAVIGMIRHDLNRGIVPEGCPDELRDGILGLDMDNVRVEVFIDDNGVVGINVS